MTDKNNYRKTTFIIFASVIPFLLVRLFTRASTEMVWVFGKETHLGCWFKDYFGFPCPYCGITRSIILTLYGDFHSAFQLNVAGPLFICGIGMFLVSLTVASLTRTHIAEKRTIIISTIYFSFVTLVSFANWIMKIINL